jgi:hypothetical protein
MKRFYIITQLLAVCSAVALFQNCSSDDGNPVDPQDAIAKTWIVNTNGLVTKDGTNLTSDYIGLTLTFNSDGTYTTTNGKMLLQSSGTWNWVGNDVANVMLDGDFPVTVKNLAANSLEIAFTMDEEHVNTGRSRAVLGNYIIKLQSK